MITPKGTLVVPQRYLPLLGAGAAALATLAYILWGPDTNRRGPYARSKRRKVAGLENLGNTCYLNTILQSLAACPAFVKWLSRALRQGFFKGKLNELAYKLSKTLEVVNDHSVSHGGSQVYSPHEVLHALYNCSWKADRGQQDAHELFQFLLSVLGEEKEPISSPVPLCDASRLIEPGRNGLMAHHSDLHSNIEANLPKVAIRDGGSPFRGLLANHLSCTICGHRNPVTYSSFDCLTLPIPATVFGTLSLESILAKFTQRELVHDVDCTECSKELAGKTAPPSRRNAKWTAQPAARGLVVPPTPKHVAKASSFSRAAATLPAYMLPCEMDAPSSELDASLLLIEPTASQIYPPSSPSSLPAPPVVALVTDLHPVLAPPTFGLATPNGDHHEPVPDLQRRTPPREVSSSDSMAKVADSADALIEDAEDSDDNIEAHVTHDTGAPPCLAMPAETTEEQVDKTSSENSIGVLKNNILEVTEEENQQHHATPDFAQDVDVELIPGRECNGEALSQSGLGKDSVLDVADPASSDSVVVHHQASPSGEPAANEREDLINVEIHSRHPDSILQVNSLSADSAGCNNVTQPRCRSTPNSRPSPPKKGSSSTDRSSAVELGEPSNLSIFGRIPGTDGMATSPTEPATRSTEDIGQEASLPKCRRIFRKQLTLGKLPQCLCIHLQRVTWLANGLPSRREEHVIFPEYLDLSPYRQTATMMTSTSAFQNRAKLTRIESDASDDFPTLWDTPWDTPRRKASSQCFIGGNFLLDNMAMSLVGGGLNQMSPRVAHNPPGTAEKDAGGALGVFLHGETAGRSDTSSKHPEARYRLASAVVHQGDAYSGHFLTFRRAPSTGNEPLSDNWLCISDESVYTSTTKEVFSQKAYMLYYQRT